MKKVTLMLILLIGVAGTAWSQVLITLVFGDKLNAPGLGIGLETGANCYNNRGFESINLLGTFNLELNIPLGAAKKKHEVL